MRLSNFLPLLIVLPSVIIGAAAMYFNGISTFIWSQNLVVSLIAGLLSCFILIRKPKIKKRKSAYYFMPITILLLLLTFLDSGIDGVHRWVSLGPIKFYISSIFLPVLLIELWGLLQCKNWWHTVITTIGVAILLTLQPDASQATGFIIPMLIILWSKSNHNFFRYIVMILLLILVIVSWVFIDSLSPVAHVEGIINMVADLGVVWFILGVISLIILPVPFILFPPKEFKLLSICLGLYFIIILICTQFGNFPVPLMGYGTSPIIGYFIAITWLIKTKKSLH